jgi:UDP-N-acetylmuramoyl-tripeptide--D-alanyl-D-alanine ligase
MRLPLDVALRATGATLQDGDSPPATLTIRTDTRTLAPGDTFLALSGERYDGHDFAEEAVRRGAAMLVLQQRDQRGFGVPTMLVGDTKAAYMALAGAARELFAGRVVAITGSAGKTTTKAFLTQILAAHYGDRVLAAPGNENNEIGVSKLLLSSANARHDIIVVEMGARHYGDVAELVEIARPQIGILTNVGEAHLEIMGSRERLEATKWALFSGDARPVLNAADDLSRRRAPSLAQTPHWFAAVLPADAAGLPILTTFDGERRILHRDGSRSVVYDVDLRIPGAYNRANLAAAVAGALELGLRLDAIVAQIPFLELPEGRYHRIQLAGGVALIYDAYNANASGMMAALDTFAAESASRRIAVLASMAELGSESQELHERVGEHAARRVDLIVVEGEFAQALALGAQRGGLSAAQIVTVESNAQAARWLRNHVRQDDVVLLKGSRKYKLEEIVEELCR